ncbi:hypothetical protein [Glycomyces sp. YM15]|uniref:hypothetical protein n=1 Tax=Glycomyces sp. YM15 TaxID=2800446 RepID=UPI001965218A|nr:hypothetical protein [Glycomyces sp. YM15]
MTATPADNHLRLAERYTTEAEGWLATSPSEWPASDDDMPVEERLARMRGAIDIARLHVDLARECRAAGATYSAPTESRAVDSSRWQDV